MKPKDEPVEDVDFGKRDECMNKKPGLGTAGRVSFLSGCQLDKVSCPDQSYLKFLRGVWVSNNGSLTYDNGNCIVKYDENLGAVKVTPLSYRKPETTTYRKKATPSKPSSSRMAVNEGDSDSVVILDTKVKDNREQTFKKKLRKFLLNPYDKKELRERFKAAKVRLPLEGERRTRRRTLPYATEEPGLSYFDRHPDLEEMIEDARQENQKRALALLRCLSFFYENVSDPGSFVPWVNPKSWLHDIICSCVNIRKCPMKANGVSHGKRHHC
ncbi:hypothetical protein FRX31_002263 [Thalictrum thalictroides]|uniref:Uncharacterized protein n=1 Tax=Thalictrum thalictroides TaxID=46969 RepID=A0A7J6XG74_THATH|nr:hypothetical protein FRX31_002263 [Thalictrum thalictroides]